MALTDTDEKLLASMLPELIVPGTIATAVVGSFGRGNPRPESDVDVTRFVVRLQEAETERYRIAYRSERLVSVLDTTLDHVHNGLGVPERAIWTVPYLRSVRPLYDPEGEIVRLREEAQSFDWAPLQPRANQYASHRLMKFSEEALKLGLGLRAHDEQRIMTETTWLILGLPLVIAVQRGILLDNEMRAPIQVQQAIGCHSLWSQHYRVAAGLGGAATLEERAQAALALYAVTVELLDDVLKPEHRSVIEETLRRVQSSARRHSA
jgi:predicted nucleotidyltransferase